LGPMNEFRDMVKALHRVGIEVILDVVFNHTAEGDHSGPTLSFRGLEDRAYYLHDQQNPGRYANYSGCGNTINANHSIVRRMIIDCLQYWVQGMHVDGFRFDLASVLARDESGIPLKNPPILWEIESDPILASTKIIAEAWDASGLYQVGSFIGHRWAEWNGQYRDDVRRFAKSDPDTVSRLAQAEAYLLSLGLRQVRVRHHGEIARLEVDPADMPHLLEKREEVSSHLRSLGYTYVALDLQGYRSGSMNEVLPSLLVPEA